ncbi:hypothetical protein HDZ31DRAFT_47197 [Schizophyllum fasciatum]
MDFFTELPLRANNTPSSAPCEEAHPSYSSSTRHDAAAPVSEVCLDDVEIAPVDYERHTVAFYCVVA